MQELTIKQKLTNYYYFVIFNSILACVIGVGYWFQRPFDIYISTPKLTDWLDIFYIITTHFSIITLVVFVVSLAILPTIYLKPKKAILIQVILFNLLLAILVCDVKVFQCDKIHIFSITITTFIEVITFYQSMFTTNKAIACACLLILLWIIYKTQQWINKSNWLNNHKIGSKFTSLLLVSSVISVLTYQLTTKEKQHQLLAYIQYLPINQNNNDITTMYKQVKYNKLQYPLQPLQTTEVINPPNILIIAIDAWRADCFNEQDSPNLWGFAKQGIIFTNHFSGSNHTYNGLFSLLYGIPAIYCDRFQQQKITSLLFSRLKQLDYQINCFSDNYNIEWLKFFTDIKNLSMINNNISRVYQKDPIITEDWLNYHANLDKTKPWFSFVFYDSVHGLDFPENYSTIAEPAGELYYFKKFSDKYGKDNFITTYKTAVHYTDSLANKILQKLKVSNDLENTIVIITSDHGCEWDDNNQGTYGSRSNFTNCQIQVPFAIILPKQFQQKLINQQDNLTTHYDIIPTLMHNFLGVINNIEDYSIGNNLLNNKNTQEWHLACSSGKYRSYTSAIIENNKVLKILPSGIINYLDNFNQLIFNKSINTQYLNQTLEMMTRFIKK